MKTLILEGRARYAVTADRHATPFARDEIRKLTAAILARTGAAMPVVFCDEAGNVRELCDENGRRTLKLSSAGDVEILYDREDQRLAVYGEDGTVSDVYYRADGQRSAKRLARLRADGGVAQILDEKEKLLALLDETGALAAVYHAAGDLLTEADEEYAERRACAEERLAAAREVLTAIPERRAEADATLAAARDMRDGGREILCGRIKGNEKSESAHEGLSYTAYSVALSGETLTVAAFTESLLGRGLTALAETLLEGSDAWTLAEDFSLYADDARVATVLPEYKTENGVLEGSYYCGDENYEICFSGTTLSEYETYLDELCAVGFAPYDENAIGDCRFATYLAPDERAGEVAVFTMFWKGRGRTQIVWGPRAYLPPTEPAPMPENPVRTTLAQPRRLGAYCLAPGMSYVVQLADGGYIVIDGGPADRVLIPKVCKKGAWVEAQETQTQDARELYEYLRDHAPNGEKPRIAAWFITHPHGDHMGLANRFLLEYEGKIEIELTAFNFPDFDTVYCKNELTGNHKGNAAPFRANITERYGAKTCVLHTGQRLYFAGCEVEVLYTQEDYYPTSFAWGNHMSCAFRMKFADKTALILGDVEKTNCQQMADSYGEHLKSDILQLTHHGFNGACLDINRLADPDVCLWACDGFRFSTDARAMGTVDGYAFNRYLRDKSIKKREHYHCDETVILEV